MNLWHLFKTEEDYKLGTFLAGGLWCADLGSIIGYSDDVEGTGPQGLFVSCWHATEGDPTSEAWEVFGGNGDGFAIRTTVEELQSYATCFDNAAMTARLGFVEYVPKDGTITDPAFQVHEHHEKELEMRLLLALKNLEHGDDEIKKQIRRAAAITCERRGFSVPIKQLILSDSYDSEFAMILPIDAPGLFKEFLIGSQVEPRKRDSTIQFLKAAGVTCRFRQLQSQP